jgi:hypothetical protein
MVTEFIYKWLGILQVLVQQVRNFQAPVILVVVLDVVARVLYNIHSHQVVPLLTLAQREQLAL